MSWTNNDIDYCDGHLTAIRRNCPINHILSNRRQKGPIRCPFQVWNRRRCRNQGQLRALSTVRIFLVDAHHWTRPTNELIVRRDQGHHLLPCARNSLTLLHPRSVHTQSMPLPDSATLSLQGHSKPGDALPSIPKQAMIVRMSAETLDALEMFPNQPPMEFAFGKNPVSDARIMIMPAAQSFVH